MAIFNSYVSLPEGKSYDKSIDLCHGKSWTFRYLARLDGMIIQHIVEEWNIASGYD